MSRLVWLLVGLVGGIIAGRNSPAMNGPVTAAVLAAAVVGGGVCWAAGYRGKSQAVAAAVAVATAAAAADAEANAQAIAQAAVHLHLAGQPHPVQLDRQHVRARHGQLEEHHLEEHQHVESRPGQLEPAPQTVQGASARLWLPAHSRP